MKISPLPSNGIAGSNFVQEPKPVSIKPSDTITEEQSKKIELDSANRPINKIKLKVNQTPQIPVIQEQTEEPPAPEVIPEKAEEPVVEDTKPLDPQLAALARQRRALQVKERELADKAKALEERSSQSNDRLVERIKSDPLSVLQEYGVTYDQLTQSILDNNYNPEISALKAELKALKEGVDKTLSDKDIQQEQQVLNSIKKESEQLSQSDKYEMIRLTDSHQDVVDLIHKTYKESGEVLGTEEAMDLIEEELTKDALRLANSNKLKAKQSQPEPQVQPKPPIKTLTSRDTARPILDRKQRAIAAALGQLGNK